MNQGKIGSTAFINLGPVDLIYGVVCVFWVRRVGFFYCTPIFEVNLIEVLEEGLVMVRT